MLPNAFIGKPKKPTENDLSAELGAAKPLWDQLLVELADLHDPGLHEWHSYSLKAGWSLKVKHGTRTILYLSPFRGGFRASLALGDKAVKAALQSDLPARVLKIIRGAKRYAEGTAVRIEVETTKDLPIIRKLAALKLEN
jgi:hypothetical protein